MMGRGRRYIGRAYDPQDRPYIGQQAWPRDQHYFPSKDDRVENVLIMFIALTVLAIVGCNA